MKIELRKFKYAEFASEETRCFEAEVYIDGKKAGFAHNEGHGGPTDIEPRSLHVMLNEYAKPLPRKVSTIRDESDPTGFFTYEQDGESLIEDLVTEMLIERDLKRDLKRKILFVSGNEIRGTKNVKKEVLARWLGDNLEGSLKALKCRREDILNLMPYGEALRHYREKTGEA